MLFGGIHKERHAVLVRDRDALLPRYEAWLTLAEMPLGRQVIHHRRLFIERGAELLFRLNNHKPRTGRPWRVIVSLAVAFLDDHLVLHSRRVGKLMDFVAIGPRHTSRRRDRCRARRPGAHERRLDADYLRDMLSRVLVKVVERHEHIGRRPHGIGDFGCHQRATQGRQVPRGVDNRLDAEFFKVFAPGAGRRWGRTARQSQ